MEMNAFTKDQIIAICNESPTFNKLYVEQTYIESFNPQEMINKIIKNLDNDRSKKIYAIKNLRDDLNWKDAASMGNHLNIAIRDDSKFGRLSLTNAKNIVDAVMDNIPTPTIKNDIKIIYDSCNSSQYFTSVMLDTYADGNQVFSDEFKNDLADAYGIGDITFTLRIIKSIWSYYTD